jgi:alkanesulfonate monooxygenase SsuD/methylene tetrahydromethanopterin reductase-like flavin-dependent oxidoreductase (luciferase family)
MEVSGMRFGLPGGRGDLDPRGPVPTLELARVADELGYECLWFGEQQLHAGAGGARFQRSPVVAAAAVAAVTTRIRVGFSVLLPALHDPVRLAGDITTLDVLSGGRVNFGVGWPDPRLPNTFARHAEAEATLQDRLDTLLGFWGGQPAVIDGVDYEIAPTLQQPYPPVYVAARDDDAIAWAAERGYGLILPGARTPSSVRRCLDLFGSSGGDPGEVPVERFCLVAESDAEALRQARPLVERLTGQLSRSRPERVRQDTDDEDLEPERFLRDTALVGSPETVARRVAELRDELGVQYVNLRPSIGGNCPPALQKVTVELFATEIMPRLATPDPQGASQ